MPQQSFIHVVVKDSTICREILAAQGDRDIFHDRVADRIGMSSPLAFDELYTLFLNRDLFRFFDNDS
jgi:hypothetical protein